MNSRPSAMVASGLLVLSSIIASLLTFGGSNGVMQSLSIYEIINNSQPSIVYEDIRVFKINLWSGCITDSTGKESCTFSSAHPKFGTFPQL